jgi:galactose oxidase
MATPHPGKWELVLNQTKCELNTQDTAIHACVIHNPDKGTWKVLYFSGTQSRIWDPANPTQVSSPQVVPNWPPPDTDPPNLFCSGHTHMPDGRLLVGGGHREPIIPPPPCPQETQFRGLPYTYFFDPISEQWSIAGPPTNPHRMADSRWYPTLTMLGEGPGYGMVIAMSGLRKEISSCYSVVNKDPEKYDPLTGWSKMANPPAAVQPFDDLYTGAHLIPYGAYAGKIFYSMPMTQAYVFNPFFSGPPNGGYWTPIGQVRTKHRLYGNSILLPLLPSSTMSKVLIIGGGDPATNTVESIDLASGPLSWSPANPMFFARRDSNAVLLPNDQIVVIGGDASSGINNPVYTAEVYDVASDVWSLLPAMNRQRLYHSVGILLPDGRVWVSGTLVGPYAENNIELYYPGYLFEGERPEILQAPDTIYYGQQFGTTVSMSFAALRLIRLGVTTHATDMEQRSVGLTFGDCIINGGVSCSVDAPTDANIAPPGYYMLFVLRAKSGSISGQTMIPSVAKIVKLDRP